MNDFHHSISDNILPAATMGTGNKDWFGKETKTMTPGEWDYDWIHINEKISVYLRVRDEGTSDGMPRPYVETLAYIQKMIGPDSPAISYRALLHTGEMATEMDLAKSSNPMLVMDYIQRYFNDR